MRSSGAGARARTGLTVLEVLMVVVMLALVAVPVLGLGTVDQRAAAQRLERIERLSALRELAEQLAARPVDDLRRAGAADGVLVGADWIAAMAPGCTFRPGPDRQPLSVRLELEQDVRGATGLHRITLALELPSARQPLAVTRLVEER